MTYFSWLRMDGLLIRKFASTVAYFCVALSRPETRPRGLASSHPVRQLLTTQRGGRAKKRRSDVPAANSCTHRSYQRTQRFECVSTQSRFCSVVVVHSSYLNQPLNVLIRNQRICPNTAAVPTAANTVEAIPALRLTTIGTNKAIK